MTRAASLPQAAPSGLTRQQLVRSVAFMWGVRFRIRRARRLAGAGRHREASRSLKATAAACERFLAAHPEWVRT